MAASCPMDDFGFESFDVQQVFEVRTGRCNYLSVSQGLDNPLPSGSQVEITAYHFELQAPEPAQAHLALWIDGEPALDRQIDIPAPAAGLVETWTAPRDLGVNAPVIFHIDNHGTNAWMLIDLRLLPEN